MVKALSRSSRHLFLFRAVHFSDSHCTFPLLSFLLLLLHFESAIPLSLRGRSLSQLANLCYARPSGVSASARYDSSGREGR